MYRGGGELPGAYVRISVTMFALMTVGQWWAWLLDLVIPSLYFQLRRYYLRSSIAKINRQVYRAREYLDLHEKNPESSAAAAVEKRAGYVDDARSAAWEEALMMRHSTFTDYTSLTMQLGLVLLFAMVFPLAPLLALLNNLVFMRLGAVKLCYFRQRPVAHKVSGIGVWEDLMQVMSTVGILTNCGVMAFTSTVLKRSVWGRELGPAGIVLLLMLLEHVVLFFKYWLHVSVPRVPLAVQRSKNRDRTSPLPPRPKKPRPRKQSSMPLLFLSTPPSPPVPHQEIIPEDEKEEEPEPAEAQLEALFSTDIFADDLEPEPEPEADRHLPEIEQEQLKEIDEEDLSSLSSEEVDEESDGLDLDEEWNQYLQTKLDEIQRKQLQLQKQEDKLIRATQSSPPRDPRPQEPQILGSNIKLNSSMYVDAQKALSQKKKVLALMNKGAGLTPTRTTNLLPSEEKTKTKKKENVTPKKNTGVISKGTTPQSTKKPTSPLKAITNPFSYATSDFHLKDL